MTSAEKRRSGRKSGGHRKHSDGGYSDTSSGGSFLDENDREVSNLTDRAFRSLCIGDEAVYNDSDLGLSSPCIQRDRQLAFSHSGQDRDREDREREELKRAAHENFSLRVQQYGPDWIHGGMYGAEVYRDPQWEVYGERTQGRVSATFQHSFVETSQQEKSVQEEQLSFFSNGATELSSQQRRSRSRVSSLIRAFNSEGQRDGVGVDDKLRDWNDETSWDKSALMSIERELSEFSTSYQQNFNSGPFPSAGPFSSQDTNFYSPEVAAVGHMAHNSASFMRSSHSKHSMSAQVNWNSNLFIHSEFSPFKVWRDHNRFPFQQGDVSGFMHCSEFPKWYETPMYRELSLEHQPQGPYRGIRNPRSNLAPVVAPTPPRSTSASTMLQKASAVEKRCESESAGHYAHRKRTQSLGNNRLPSQRPSTASPTIEMSRRVRDTISSVKALQQKIKMMAEQNITAGVIENQQGVVYSNDNLMPFGGNGVTMAPNVVSSNTSTTPFNMSQRFTPSVNAHREAATSDFQQHAVSPYPVEHPPVRAESRGATPDVRMSSYKSRATSLLFNLKDNRKRVKSTYSPPKFKGSETQEKTKQPSVQEPRETVIDIPDFPEPDIQFSQLEESSRTNASMNQYYNPATAHTGQYPEYISDYQTAQMQGQMVHHSGFTGFIPENYSSNQLANGQNLYEDLASFAPYKQGVIDNVGTLRADACGHKPSYTATEPPRLNADNNQSREYLISKANTEQPFNETVGRVFTKVDRYERLKGNKHDYNNVSSQDKWRQANSQDIEKHSLKAAISPWKQETTALMEKTRQDNQPSINKEVEGVELRESFGVGTSSHKKAALVNTNISNQTRNDTVENAAYYGQQQPLAIKDNNALLKYSGHNEGSEVNDNYLTQNYNRYTDQEYRSQRAFYSTEQRPKAMQETGQGKQYIPKGHEVQSLQSLEAQPQVEHNIQKNSLSNPTSATTMVNQMTDRRFVEVKAEEIMAENINAQHTQAELPKSQQWAQVEQPKAESAVLILAGRTGSEKAETEQAESELTEHGMVKQARAEHVKEMERTGEQTEQSRENQSERAGEEQKRAEQPRVQRVAEQPRNITEEAEAEHTREQQGKQGKAEQAQTERLKEEHINTELSKAEQGEQARLNQATTDQATGKTINAEQVKEDQASTEQVEREQTEAEQIRTEKVNAEQDEAERRTAEQTKIEQGKEQQTKAEQVTARVNAHHVKAEGVSRAKHGEDLIQVGGVIAEQSTTQRVKEIKTEDRKAEQAKLKLTKGERAKELTKTENMQERSAKLTAKLTAARQVKSEPDKVQKVKTELANAKAELAKIKEKMRSGQKEKVRNAAIIKEDDAAKNNVPLNTKTNVNYNKQDQAVQMHQQEEDTAVRNGSGQTDRGAADYSHLREKYGFSYAVSTNTGEVSTTENVSSKESKETQVLSPDQVETVNNEKLKEERSPTSRLKTENKEEGDSSESREVIDNQYVYSESSKEFKLSSMNHSPADGDKSANSDAATDKVKDDSAEKLEKCDRVKDTNVSQQRDSDLAKLLPLERKPKSTEHNVGPSKDQHFTPPKPKERAQTKQEILTSKIKAHAEKEISAIKEKGFAMRDGFMSKGSPKQLAGSQSVNIRQRPPSQEVPKKPESSMSSSITPKHQMEPSGVPREPPPKSVTIPVKSAATSTPELERQAKQTGSTISTTEGLVQNQKQVNRPGIMSPIQNKEQAPKIEKEKQQANHGEISGKQKEGLQDNSAINNGILNKMKEEPSQAAGVEAASSTPLTTEKAESKEDVHEDSEPSLSLALGQKETPVAGDDLQIMGIMVSVRERKLSVNIGEGHDSTQKQMNAAEEDCSNSALDKGYPNSGREVSKGQTSSTEVITEKAMDTQETEYQGKAGINNPRENVQETRENNVTGSVTENRTKLQQDTCAMTAKPQRETRLEAQAERVVPFTVTVPAKNKVSPETQPLPYKQDVTARETKDIADIINSAESRRTDEVKTQNMQAAHANDSFTAKVVNTGINNKNDVETLIKHGVQPSVKGDMTTVQNQSKSCNTDGKSAPLPEDKTQDSTPPKTFNEDSLSNNLTETENRHGSQKRQRNEAHTGESNQEDDDVHIDCIAIRVVPAITEDNVKMVGKHHITTVPSDAALANEHNQVASCSCEEKANTLNNEDRTKEVAPASSGKKMKDSLEVQHVLSSVRKLSDSLKTSHQQSSTNTTNENTENGRPDDVKKSGEMVAESNTQPVEGGYFQVQGVAETSKEPRNNSAAVGNASKGGERPGSLPNKSAIIDDSHKEGKNEAFVFSVDQGKKKTVESSSVSGQGGNMKRKTWETEHKLASKQFDGSTERLSSNEKLEAGQANPIRKHHSDNQSALSAMERQSSRNPHPKRESAAKEKPEVKPKPKERASTIPEISALADYARLKVIVSEDAEVNPVQEFPPNKKEGFFPLIQSRHSRRPVFTADPQELSAKEKSLPNKAEMSAKVNKEPKALVFPITEKEHQRTGMFKLGDKERPEKMPLDTTVNGGVSDKYVHHKERSKSPTAQTEQIAGAGTPRVSQVDQSMCQPNNHPLQATTSSSAVNRSRNTAEGLTYLDKNSPPHPTMHNLKENTTSPRKDERIEKQQDEDTGARTEDGRTDQLKQEKLASQHDETKPQPQGRIKQLEEASRSKEEKREDVRIKHMIEESRASLAEEEKRAIQREEERRARDREAIAVKIKERREKQREAERRAEEERKARRREEERAAQKEEERRAKQREEEVRKRRRLKMEEEEQKKENEERRRVKKQQEEKAALEEKQRRAVQEHQRRAVQEEQQRAAQEEQQRRAVQEEQQRRAAQEEQQRRAAQEEQQRAVQEEQQRAVQEEQQRAVQEEQQRRAVQEEQQRRAAQEEQQRAVQEEQQRAVQEEQQRAVQEEQQRAVQEEQQRRAAQEEQQRRAAQEEQQRAVQEEQQRAAQEEQQRAAQEEQQRAAQEEQQRRAVQEEQQRRAAQEEQQRRAAQEEQQRRAAQEEQQRAAQEEQQRRAAQEEQQRRAEQEKQQRRAAQEEQQRRAVQEEQQRRAVQEEQQRRAAQEEQQRAAQEEQQRRAVQEEQQRRALQEEQQRAAQEEQQRRAVQEEQQRRALQEEQQRAALEEQQRRRALIEEQRRAKEIEENILEEEKKRKQREEENAARISEEERFKQIQEQQMEEQRRERHKKEEWMRAQREEERRAGEKQKITNQREEIQAKEERTRLTEERRVALHEEKRVAHRDDGIQAGKRGEEETLAAHREKQKRASDMEALQYYAINSTKPEGKAVDRQLLSPLPSQQRNNPPGLESTVDSASHTRPYRPHAPASPAPSLPRSNTSSPALGAKPSMFRVKDNTIRGSSFTKSVKPRFHKNYGENFWGGSLTDRGEEEQDMMRRSAGTPVYPDTGLNRLAAINESSTFQSASSSQHYSGLIPHHRPYSRRSLAMDEDDSRSVISNMSEDVESFATSAADLADIRGLYDSERPESACSFNSDASRSLGKPPAVPPKSEKALRRAQRLTTRRIKKELTKTAADSPAGVEKEASSILSSSSSTEVRSSSRHAVASPHFSSPVSLAHAPTLGPSLPSSHAEHHPSHRSSHASPHATGPISLQVSSPHATAPVSLPTVSPHATGSAAHPAVSKTVAHVPSSPTLHHANHPAPVTQYQVESSYPQSYPLTQRKVLQDLGSGQYFVVDVPVQVKTKTFFDPETGKYVQLNVRESGQSISQPQPQQTCPQPQLQPQMQLKPQQKPLSQNSPAGKPVVFYPGYHGYPQGYQPAAINSMYPHRPSAPATLQQNQQPLMENHSYGYPALETGQNSEGHRYSPEKTPYMDTVNDMDKTYNTVYRTHGSYESFPECDTNSQLAGSAVCENDNSAHSRYQSRDIITMSELDDFMEMSDW